MTEYRTINGVRLRSFIIPAQLVFSNYEIAFDYRITRNSDMRVTRNGDFRVTRGTSGTSAKEIKAKKRGFRIPGKVKNG